MLLDRSDDKLYMGEHCFHLLCIVIFSLGLRFFVYLLWQKNFVKLELLQEVPLTFLLQESKIKFFCSYFPEKQKKLPIDSDFLNWVCFIKKVTIINFYKNSKSCRAIFCRKSKVVFFSVKLSSLTLFQLSVGYDDKLAS